MRLRYLKMHCTGNQSLIIDQRHEDHAPPSTEQLRKLGDASTGPGFDQLMWVTPARDATMAASYRVFNADGSEVEQCGNGVRCVAWMLARNEKNERVFRLESPAGPIEARVLTDGRVAVNMGQPEFHPARIPFVADGQSDQYSLEVDGSALDVSVLSMGNPHCVLRVADVNDAPVAKLGPLIEHHRRFPAGTNVGFMAIDDKASIDLRVHERGVGETPACGTGACAAVVAGQRLGQLDDEVAVHLPGGQLVVSWRGAAGSVWLTGEAELISEGTIDL